MRTTAAHAVAAGHVGARGSAAHGYFQVYEPLSSLTSAAFLNDPKAKTRVFVADDHPFLRVGLTHLINKEADMTVCGEAETIAAVRSGLEKSQPDVLLTDLCLGDGDG